MELINHKRGVMILDNEQQRKHLLAMIAATPLAGGTLPQLKPQIAILEELETAVKLADIAEFANAEKE